MNYSDMSKSVLDPDIIQAAYLKSSEEVKRLVSSVLTSLKEENAYIYSYIDINTLIEASEKNNQTTPYGFTSVLGADEEITWLIISVMEIFERVENGADLRKLVLSYILKKLTDEDYKSVIKEVGRNG